MRKNILSFILCMIITSCAMTACDHDKGQLINLKK